MASECPSLTCPITCEVFHDPVLAEDGHTYERDAIERWIRENGTSPLTRQSLSLENLRPNCTIKKVIADFEESLRKKNYQYTLGVDVKKKDDGQIFESHGKFIYQAEWVKNNENQPKIILLKINGARAKKEAAFHVRLTRHPHIVRTFGLVYDKEIDNDSNRTILLQEYAPHGTLYRVLEDQKRMPCESVLIKIFLQIIDAMIFLALNDIVHGDLACRNILVFKFDENDPKNNVVKVTDFGLSRNSQIYTSVPTAGRSVMDIVPIRYVAPEILLDRKNPANYTEKSDIYSMGVLMWEAYSRGLIPWSDIEREEDVIESVLNGNLLTQPCNCSAQYWDIIVKTWAKSPNDRPTFQQLKDILTEKYCCAESTISSTDRPSEDQYVGPLKDGKKHGHGIYHYGNKWKYEGEFIYDQKHGQGVQTWPSGKRYEGAWKNDKRHGFGTFVTETGESYVGEWIDSKMNGEGAYTWSNGNRYQGTYKDNKKHGYGTWHEGNGSTYVGHWLGDKMHGQGVRIYRNGDRYEGNFKDGIRHDHGVYYYVDGSKYEGKWIDDKKNSYGVHTNSNGDRYEGNFKDGKKHGQGMMIYTNGEKYIGSFIDDKISGSGVKLWSDGNRYEGSFKDDEMHGHGISIATNGEQYVGKYARGKKNGQGVYTYSNGDRYEGSWKDGQCHGKGKYILADGRVKEGTWCQDKFIK